MNNNRDGGPSEIGILTKALGVISTCMVSVLAVVMTFFLVKNDSEVLLKYFKKKNNILIVSEIVLVYVWWVASVSLAIGAFAGIRSLLLIWVFASFVTAGFAVAEIAYTFACYGHKKGFYFLSVFTVSVVHSVVILGIVIGRYVEMKSEPSTVNAAPATREVPNPSDQTKVI